MCGWIVHWVATDKDPLRILIISTKSLIECKYEAKSKVLLEAKMFPLQDLVVGNKDISADIQNFPCSVVCALEVTADGFKQPLLYVPLLPPFHEVASRKPFRERQQGRVTQKHFLTGVRCCTGPCILDSRHAVSPRLAPSSNQPRIGSS
jgi:hypothetical protein